MKDYVDNYPDKRGRADVKCPYCGRLHAVSFGALEWGCRACGNVFDVPFLAQIPIIRTMTTHTGLKQAGK
jgi:ribosomal protein L37AE/L43A